MNFPPPTGSRDLLPLEVLQKTWIRERLQAAFHRWGYHRVVTPTLERLDTLVAGGRVRPERVVQIQDRDGIYGLRPDVTASIARIAASRWGQMHYPQRLYYVANVFRPHPQRGHCQEFYQVGVELLGAAGLLADGEMLRLLQDGLTAIQLPPWRVIVGEAGLTRLWIQSFPPALQPLVTAGLMRLDRVALGQLPSPWREQALAWLDVRGEPAQVFQRLATWELTPAQWQRVNHLKSLVELLPPGFPAGAGFESDPLLGLLHRYRLAGGGDAGAHGAVGRTGGTLRRPDCRLPPCGENRTGDWLFLEFGNPAPAAFAGGGVAPTSCPPRLGGNSARGNRLPCRFGLRPTPAE